MSREPPTLPGASVLPPMDPAAPTPARTKRAGSQGVRRHRDRFAVLNAFGDDGARLVDTTAQACWWIVFRETKPDGLARVAHARIAECVGTSLPTVQRAMRRLEGAKLLTVVRRGGLREGPSTYRVHGTPKRARPPP